MRRPTRRRWLVTAILGALGLTGALGVGTVLGTPGAGVSATPPDRGTIDEPFKLKIKGLVHMKTKQSTDLATQTITIQPGGHTGWHSHPGPAFVIIKSGTLTFYDGDDRRCSPHAFSAGKAFVDRGGGHVHIARNEGTVPVELSVAYLLPAGAPTRTDAANPGNCPF